MNPMQLLMGNNKNNIESEREDKKKNLITEVSILRWQKSHFEHSAKLMLLPMVSIKSLLLMISPSIYMFSLRGDFLVSAGKLTECLIIISIIMWTFWTLETPYVLF